MSSFCGSFVFSIFLLFLWFVVFPTSHECDFTCFPWWFLGSLCPKIFLQCFVNLVVPSAFVRMSAGFSADAILLSLKFPLSSCSRM